MESNLSRRRGFLAGTGMGALLASSAVHADSQPARDGDSECVNVKELGAKGDGVTDDWEAFSRAIDQGRQQRRSVRIPEGYGFTFLNVEAIHYGLASDSQSKAIFQWLDGRREVAGDTSVGSDIYHWRFGPRATTKRNVENYVWPWFNPEQIAWGNQVQDGGAVLGFSYFDLMARLKVHGPDDAWDRLREIIRWFGEVQAAGGYRAYYSKPGRGMLQGGGPPGGLGVDREFLESVLVPQVMLYGFMGIEPSAEGLRVTPRLPKDWPELTITGIRYRDHVLDLTVNEQTIRVRFHDHGIDPPKILLSDSETRELRVEPRR